MSSQGARMGFYPVALDVSTRPVVVTGTGREAAAKVAALVAAEAQVVLIDPEATSAVAAWAEAGRLTWHRRPPVPDDFGGASLVMAAGTDPEANRQVATWAREAGVLVNCLDDPPFCDCYAMAQVRRGPLAVAVTTSGQSPAVAAYLRRRLDGWLTQRWDAIVQRANTLRPQVRGAWGAAEWDRWLDEQLGEDKAPPAGG